MGILPLTNVSSCLFGLVLLVAPLVKGQCPLCEDGSAPPNLEFEINTQTCAELSDLASSESGERCTAAQATFGVYCGCSNPIASSGACRVCGDDTLLPIPGLVVIPDTPGGDCINLEFTANIDSEGITCEQAQVSSVAETCCSPGPGPGTGPQPSQGPLPATFEPSLTPTVQMMTTGPTYTTGEPSEPPSQNSSLVPTAMPLTMPPTGPPTGRPSATQMPTTTTVLETMVTLQSFSLSLTAQDLDRDALMSTITSYLFSELSAVYANLMEIVLEEGHGQEDRYLQQTTTISYDGTATFQGAAPPASEVVDRQTTALENTNAVQMAIDANPSIGTGVAVNEVVVGESTTSSPNAAPTTTSNSNGTPVRAVTAWAFAVSTLIMLN